MNTLSMKWNGLIRSTTTRIKAFVTLNVLDYALTVLVVQTGIGSEANILYGESLITAGVCKVGLGYIVIRHLAARSGIMAGVNIGLLLVVAWNMSVLVWM